MGFLDHGTQVLAHGFHVAERNLLSIAGIENQFFQLAGDHGHIATQGVHKFAGGVGINFDLLRGGAFQCPAHGITLFHARQLNYAAEFAQGFPDAFEALFILHIHTAHVGGNIDVISDEDQQRIRIGILNVLLDSVEVFFMAAAAVEGFHPANEEHLKRGHEGGSAGAVKNFSHAGFRQIEVIEAEFTKVGGNKVLQDGIAAAAAEEGLITHQDISRIQLTGRDFGLKSFGLTEAGARQSIILQDVAHQGARKIAGEAVHGGRFFAKEGGGIERKLVFLAERIVLVVKQKFAVAVH